MKLNYYCEESTSPFSLLRIIHNYNSNLTQKFQFFKPSNGIKISNKLFTNFGLIDYPECSKPSDFLNYHNLHGKSLAQRISGNANIEEVDEIKEKYTEDASQ